MRTGITLKVPFGLLDGTLVEPHSVANGKSCGCRCPGCARPLIAYNQGKVRTTPYFGHLPGEECGKGVESAIHLAAKEALVRMRRMARPALTVDVYGVIRGIAYSAVSIPVEAAMPMSYRTVLPEVSFQLRPAAQPDQLHLLPGDAPQSPASCVLRPDLQASNDDQTDWVEIRVTHAVDAAKQKAMQDAGMRVIEIDLSDFVRASVTLVDIENAVVEDVERKAWVAHPGIPAAVARARQEAERQAELERRAEELRRIEREMRDRPPRKWLGDGVPPTPPVVVSKTEVSLDERNRALEVQQRLALGLTNSERFPKHLHMDIAGNAGALVPARLWVAQLFLDWVHGRERGRFLESDLSVSVRPSHLERPRRGRKDGVHLS